MIREATLSDMPRLVEMARRFIASSIYREWLEGASSEQVADYVRVVLEHGTIFVAERSEQVAADRVEKRVVGMLALTVQPHLLTRQLFAEEHAWWVDPEARHTSAGPRLMHYMECWCVQKGIDMVKMVAPAGSSVGDFYEKCGYRPVEGAWIKRL